MLKTEVSELHKSKRQLMEIVEQKDEDISAKNVTIQSYLEKIVSLVSCILSNFGNAAIRICDQLVTFFHFFSRSSQLRMLPRGRPD